MSPSFDQRLLTLKTFLFDCCIFEDVVDVDGVHGGKQVPEDPSRGNLIKGILFGRLN